MDAIAAEPQFLDHLAPVWRALPAAVRGRFLVDDALVDRARGHGIEPTAFHAPSFRYPRMPHADPVHDGVPCLVASIGDIKLARRLKRGPFVFMEHGAGQSYGKIPADPGASYAGGPGRQDNHVFLMPNEYSAGLWRTAYPSARVEVVGSPRLDHLPQRQPGPETIAISFHWDGPRVPYAGTALPDFVAALPALAARFRVIGHAHPRWNGRLARQYARCGIEYVAEFDDVCRRADVYVCDNSSTIFEFAATGRPVVVLNASSWRRGAGPGLRFWDAAHVGVNVDRPADLIPAVERALEHRPEDLAAREDALRFVYPFRTGAAEQAAAVILDWLTIRG